jgi:hypothetical protein
MSTTDENKKDYNINDEEDYVIIVRKDGTSNGFYPDEIMRSQGQIDARFIAATYVLQSQECFDYVVEKFRQERLPALEAAAAEPQVEATPVESEATEG